MFFRKKQKQEEPTTTYETYDGVFSDTIPKLNPYYKKVTWSGGGENIEFICPIERMSVGSVYILETYNQREHVNGLCISRFKKVRVHSKTKTTVVLKSEDDVSDIIPRLGNLGTWSGDEINKIIEVITIP